MMCRIVCYSFIVLACLSCVEELPENRIEFTGEAPAGGISVGLWLGLDSSTGFVYYPDWENRVQVELQSANDSCNLFSDFDHLCEGFRQSPSFELTGMVTPIGVPLDLRWWSWGQTIGLRDISNRKATFYASPQVYDHRYLKYSSFYYNDFAPRVGHAVTQMNEPTSDRPALWMVGGLVSTNNDFQTTGEVWKSEDGLHWDLLTQNTDLSSFRHTLNSMPDPNNNFQMTLWKIGGMNADRFKIKTLNTVSKSTDGMRWETCTAPFSPRAAQSTVVMPDINNGNKMTLWVIGGINEYDEFIMDVWKSIDGCNWTQVNSSIKDLYATHEGAFGIQTCVFEDPNNNMLPTMWLTGGVDYLNNFYNTIWKSVDGVNWERVDVKTSIFSGRHSFQFFTMNDPDNENKKTMFVLGGQDQRGWDLSDLWRSTDGIHWYGVDLYSDIGITMSGHQAVIIREPTNELDGTLYIIGSTFDAGFMTNTLIKTSDLKRFNWGITLPGWQDGNLREFK